MAKIGLQNFLFGVLTEASDGTATYGAATKPGKAVSCNVSVENNDAKLYADDGLAESDTGFKSATVTMGIDRDDLVTQAALLGHEITDGNMVRNSTDTAPYVGLGRIVTLMQDGAYKYKVEFLCKVKFGEPSQDDTTKGEDMEFGTIEIEGTASQLQSGDWAIAQIFDNRQAAVTYLNSLFGGTTTFVVTLDPNGGTGADAVTITVDDGDSVTLTNYDDVFTAPTGKTLAGWATTSDASTATYSTTLTPTEDITLYAVWSE